ncbi:hypothetical protein Bca4012_049193 [Brassica carinata]|uniref:Uncharacterized protein n=1 Tax=Brassica carinata TaxID=52824 RepID=A0A8X7UJF3_BRACI|nr:hypothetical protein Bca52824_051988 [Brassica carinata]KAG2280769.1 hypothetical protein Bca52824_051989 [Brassica carinata]
MMNLVKFVVIVMTISMALCPALVQCRQIKCDRLSGNCIKGGTEDITKMTSYIGVSHRILQGTRYIKYDALKHNVPAKQHGQKDRPDNSYRRGCTLATECYRLTN